MKMTKRDIAGFLNIDIKTLYNWKKFKPNLYKTVMLGWRGNINSYSELKDSEIK